MFNFADIDFWRKGHLAVAEWFDAWRIIPRAVVILFGYGVYAIIRWYMKLEPYLLEGCIEAGGKVTECLMTAPTTQHTALLTAMFALAAAVFGFYSKAGRSWNGFVPWNGKKADQVRSEREMKDATAQFSVEIKKQD